MNLFISTKLKYFIAVMEEGSVSKACQRMHISRTPMSKAISDIEQALGIPLFIRTKEGMTPSKFGTILYNKIVPYYNDLLKIEHCMYSDDGLPVTRIMCSKNIPNSIISHLSVALVIIISIMNLRSLMRSSRTISLQSSIFMTLLLQIKTTPASMPALSRSPSISISTPPRPPVKK